jgi:hypothetical protein
MVYQTGDTVKISMKVEFGEVTVTLTVIAILPNNEYAFVAQQRVVIGRRVDNEWYLSPSIDLLHANNINNNVAHKAID